MPSYFIYSSIHVCREVAFVAEGWKKSERYGLPPKKMIVGRELTVSGVRCMTILAQIFLAFSELKFATNCTIKHKYTD